MSRYDIDKFDPPPDPDLVCCICQCVLDNPVESPCRHVFCKVCIETWLNNHHNCPACRRSTRKTNLKPVLPLVQNMLNRLLMFCDFKDNGCGQKIMLEHYTNHIKTCGYEMVECRYPQCGLRMLRMQIENHEQNECGHREKLCQRQCGLMIPLSIFRTHNCFEELRKFARERDDLVKKLKGKVEELSEMTEKLNKQIETLRKDLSRRSRGSPTSSWSTNSDNDTDVTDFEYSDQESGDEDDAANNNLDANIADFTEALNLFYDRSNRAPETESAPSTSQANTTAGSAETETAYEDIDLEENDEVQILDVTNGDNHHSSDDNGPESDDHDDEQSNNVSENNESSIDVDDENSNESHVSINNSSDNHSSSHSTPVVDLTDENSTHPYDSSVVNSESDEHHDDDDDERSNRSSDEHHSESTRNDDTDIDADRCNGSSDEHHSESTRNDDTDADSDRSNGSSDEHHSESKRIDDTDADSNSAHITCYHSDSNTGTRSRTSSVSHNGSIRESPHYKSSGNDSEARNPESGDDTSSEILDDENDVIIRNFNGDDSSSENETPSERVTDGHASNSDSASHSGSSTDVSSKCSSQASSQDSSHSDSSTVHEFGNNQSEKENSDMSADAGSECSDSENGASKSSNHSDDSYSGQRKTCGHKKSKKRRKRKRNSNSEQSDRESVEFKGQTHSASKEVKKGPQSDSGIGGCSPSTSSAISEANSNQETNQGKSRATKRKRPRRLSTGSENSEDDSDCKTGTRKKFCTRKTKKSDTNVHNANNVSTRSSTQEDQVRKETRSEERRYNTRSGTIVQNSDAGDLTLFGEMVYNSDSDDTWVPDDTSAVTSEDTVSEEIHSDSSYDVLIPKTTNDLLNECVSDETDDSWVP